MQKKQSVKLNPPNYQMQFLIAAEKGDLATVKKLYEDKSLSIDPNAQNPSTRASPLYMAAQNGHLKVVNYLLSFDNIDVFLSCPSFTALHIAAYQGHTQVVAALLARPEAKSIINIGSLRGKFTPLHLAAQQGHVELTKLLLKTGADPQIKNLGGSTALDTARKRDIVLLLDGSDKKLHNSIIQHMQMLNFESNSEGLCFGFAEVAKIYALSGKKSLLYFYDLLFLLKRLKAKDILSMQAFHEHLIKTVETVVLENMHAKTATALDEKQYQQFQTQVLKELSLLRKNLDKHEGDSETQYLEILSLFNAFELEFSAREYPHLTDSGFNSVRMVTSNPDLNTVFPQEIVLNKSDDELTAYWLLNANLCKKTLRTESIPELSKSLPEEKSYTHPELIPNLALAFGCISSNKFTTLCLVH